MKFALPSLITICLLVVFTQICPAALSESENGGHQGGLLVVNYVSYWWLDPTGYHPAILLKVENRTGRDLTGERIRFQGRFTNIRTGMVTIGREELRKPFAPRQRLFVTVHGSDPFELPISTTEWPPLECKVMARVGDAGDEGTQTLVVADVGKVTMEDEEAFRTIEKMREFTQVSAAELARSLPPPDPLRASPASLKPARPGGKPAPAGEPGSIQSFLNRKDTPGLGDDFGAFEKRFGLPVAIEKSPPGWTFASYSNANPGLQVFAGARGHNGVDVLVVQVPALDPRNDIVAQLAKDLSGKLKGEAPGTANRSVRYLSSGRVELVSVKGNGFTALCFTGRGMSTLVLSRIGGSVEPLMVDLCKHTAMLRGFAHLFES